MDGLRVDRADTHAALLRALTAFGLGDTDGGRAPPKHAVLDWTRVDGMSAEALALFPVLVRTLAGQGVRITVCEPADGDVIDALAASGVRDDLVARCGDVAWVACACDGRRRRVEALVPAAFFAGALGKGGVRALLLAMDAALARIGLAPERAALVSDALSELVVNVLRHAEAAHATVVVLLHCRRRPRVVEIGVADSGMGITANLLQQPRHAWLKLLSDRGATAAVFGGALSGRDADAGGGGMTRIMHRLVNEGGAVVTVRSGAAKLTLAAPSAGGLTMVGHTYGWGTQTRIAVPVV